MELWMYGLTNSLDSSDNDCEIYESIWSFLYSINTDTNDITGLDIITMETNKVHNRNLVKPTYFKDKSNKQQVVSC